MYYKLNKSKPKCVEGINNKVGGEILAYIVLFIFCGVLTAAVVINFKVMFSDVRVTVFVWIFVSLLSVICALFFVKYFVPVYKKRIYARRILKNCTLTDGTVTAVNKQKIWHNGNRRSYSYYRVLLEYSYYGLDRTLHSGKYSGNYSEIPFYVGQNLMIAFNGAGSVILNKFTLSEGAEEFAVAEAAREQVDFSGLTGKLININLGKQRIAQLLEERNPDSQQGAVRVESRSERGNDDMVVFGGFLFLGIFLGLVFLMATTMIIYYKQVSEGYEDKSRFEIMQKVGMSKKEVRASIRSQIIKVFFLPLVMACIHLAAAFPMMNRLLLLFGMANVKLFGICTIATVAVFAVIYAIVYSITARSYYKIVG